MTPTDGTTAAPSAVIDRRRETIARAAVALHFQRRPDWSARFGERGHVKCLEDARYHLSFLSEAVAAGRADLFVDYARWVAVRLQSLGIGTDDVRENLDCVAAALRDELGERADDARRYLREAIDALAGDVTTPSCFLPPQGGLGELARRYLELLLAGDRHAASRLVIDAVESGTPVRDVYLGVLQSVQYEIGRLWQTNRLSVAEEHYCTAVTQFVISSLYPHVFTTERIGRTFVGACVAGDLHEVGLRMVSDFLEMAGWDTFHLGANTPTSGIIDTVKRRGAHVLGLSATMTFHVGVLRQVVEAVRAEIRRPDLRIVVGGYPFRISPDLWRRVGADGTAPDAAVALDLVSSLADAAPE